MGKNEISDHEAMHTMCLMAEFFDSSVLQHRFYDRPENKELKARVIAVSEELYDLYQAIGNVRFKDVAD